MLHYRYGAFQTPIGVNSAIHVSPACRAILDSDAIVPRAMRDSDQEGLGGMHDYSVSAYADPETAMSTLLFLYRIWQIARGELSRDQIIEMEPAVANSDFFDNEIYARYRPHEKVQRLCQIVGKERCHYPLVMGSDWVYQAERSDFCAIEFLITEQHLFTGYNYSYAQEKNLPFDDSPGFQLSKMFAVPRESRFFSGTSGEGSVWDLYGVVKDAIRMGKRSFDPYDIPDYRSPRTLQECIDEARHAYFGRPRWEYSSYQELLQYALNEDATRFQFQDLLLDFRPKTFDIEDIYQYYTAEREFRFFKPVTSDRFTAMVTVEDVIALAKQRRQEDEGTSAEPLFLKRRPFDSEFILDI